MTKDVTEDRQALLQHVLDTAKRHGATAADALFVSGRSTEVRVRLGETEQVKQSRSKGVGLRVFVGSRSATTSSSDLSKASLEDLIARTVAAARVTAEDPAARLPDAALYADEPPGDLELFDERLLSLDAETAIEMARACEDAARSADPRVTNSEGGDMSWGVSETHFANTLGVYRVKRGGSVGLWTTPLVEAEGVKERDYWYTSARYLADLASPESVGREATRRALRRLGARKPKTCQVPIIFEAPVASRLLGALAGAVCGGAVYRNASYLAGLVGERIAAPEVTIVDNPHIKRGPASKPFDGEGLATSQTVVVEGGVLKSYLLDTYSAAKLGLQTTRNASRGLAGTPSASPTNLWMQPGQASLEELIADVKQGLLVTELIGFGVNAITGDYSQGASGLWIENGQIAYPVSELTIASTLPEMWRTLDGIGSDRDPHRSVSAPSLRIAKMTVAGS